MSALDELLAELRARADPASVAGMARFGISPHGTLGGTSMDALRRMARPYRHDHALAEALWRSGVHEARILAGLVDDPAQVSAAQMERWARDFDSWDVCDQSCLNLFVHTRYAYGKARTWSARRAEYVRRAGFALMAQLAIHDRSASDEKLAAFLPLIARAATDERNYVKKAVSWALRQIGKRNAALNRAASATARELQASDSRAAKWIAADALRELESAAVEARVNR